MTRKKVVPKVERPLWQKIFLSIVLIGGVLFMYVMGLNHGAMRTSFAIGSANCELMDGMMPIYPYGCEHNDSSDNYCIDMNCQALSLGITSAYDNNGAVCLHINNSDVSKARMDAFFVSLGLTGCPGQLHTIGMNKITGNRNWLINKIEMSEWNNISKINDTRYPDKPCKIGAQFTWWTKNKVGCRLNEWKKKTGVCPYNPDIRSRKGMRLKPDKGQSRLE